MTTDLILTSFELAAEAAGDITPAIYTQYFIDCPGSEEMMNYIDPGVKIKMMNEVMRLLMVEDYQDETSYLNFEVECHQSSFNVEQHMYGNLLGAVHKVMKNVLGNDWSTDMDNAWQGRISTLLEEIQQRVAARAISA